MSGIVPSAPEKSAGEMENQMKSADPTPDNLPVYNSHFVPGPPGPAAPLPAGYAGVLPMGYYIPHQPSTFPLHQPAGSAHPLQYQPGKYPVPNQHPTPVTWMPGPAPMLNCPPGLECLTQLDNVHVLQHFEPVEMCLGFEANNRYDVKNNADEMVYIVNEDTDDLTRNAYRTLRPFVLRMSDRMGRELEVQCPPGVTIGSVAEHWNLCRAVYSIQNEKKETMLGVRGPCSTYGCGSDSVFEVQALDGVTCIGSIIRKWNGLLSAMADADHFDIRFPVDLEVKMKAMILGACFLIDYMYFERSPNQHSR